VPRLPPPRPAARPAPARRRALAATAAHAGAPVNGCTVEQATNWLWEGPTPRHVDFTCCAYAPPCVKIRPGRTRPLARRLQLPPLAPPPRRRQHDPEPAGQPIPALDAGTTSGQISFPDAGAWGFYCNFHWQTSAMYGAVIVALFADNFETGDTTAWSATVP